ncbi:MarR family winged helix-turn-helix transcriptional regulator [Legionella jordanis]|uniref:MarR family transporter transcriptional regulator n=1 Tax=Legionella jordanis TaxID=456 RepID=A0A0W0V831_9GAMM|nr:MarR family transcriptional regulator [Legionella jordanis]KTD16234.1 MarR family transporter transcriptional regulator [Legionella jordanis]RMX04546.1 MarR family transcriptional regulator [Legionella jordanis]VEH12308.1 transcriptional regulator [Legionella jordanis]HAT8713515.1 MarR family transcriptional regulator [Legionella jordanis]
MYTSTLLKKANRLLIKKANELLKPYQITHAYSSFLMELFRQEGLSQAEMSKRIGIEQPTAVRTLDRMERDGFIFRTPSPSDRRLYLIYPTEKALKVKIHMDACAQTLNELALQDFNEEEKKLFNQLIKRLNDNLEKR